MRLEKAVNPTKVECASPEAGGIRCDTLLRNLKCNPFIIGEMATEKLLSIG